MSTCGYLSALQMTDVELDERITALEENGGNGNLQNGKFKPYKNAFQ